MRKKIKREVYAIKGIKFLFKVVIFSPIALMLMVLYYSYSQWLVLKVNWWLMEDKINQSPVVWYVGESLLEDKMFLEKLKKKPVYRRIKGNKGRYKQLERKMSVITKGKYGANIYLREDDYKKIDIKKYIVYGGFLLIDGWYVDHTKRYSRTEKDYYLIFDKIIYKEEEKNFKLLDVARIGMPRANLGIDVRDCKRVGEKKKTKMVVVFNFNRESVPYDVFNQRANGPWRVGRNKLEKMEEVYKAWRFDYESEKVEEVKEIKQLECY